VILRGISELAADTAEPSTIYRQRTEPCTAFVDALTAFRRSDLIRSTVLLASFGRRELFAP
jgi:hypothetical protein